VVLGALVLTSLPIETHFSSPRQVANAMTVGGFSCVFTPAKFLPGVLIPRRGESWGGCSAGPHSGLAIHVFDNGTALGRLVAGERGAFDDTPHIYWAYGPNWFVAAQTRTIRDAIHDAVGGGVTDNTRL
jgi:hypothetical protein